MREVLKRLVDRVKRRFREIEQHEPFRSQTRDLEAKLRANRASGASHHYGLTTDTRIEQLRDRAELASLPEEIGDVDFANVIDAGIAGHEIAGIRHRLHVDGQLFQLINDLQPPAAGNRRQREQDARYAELVDEARQNLPANGPRAR